MKYEIIIRQTFPKEKDFVISNISALSKQDAVKQAKDWFNLPENKKFTREYFDYKNK
jgi:hypothetical protein